MVLSVVDVVCKLRIECFVCVIVEEMEGVFEVMGGVLEVMNLCGFEIGFVMICGCMGGMGLLFNLGEVIVICVVV